MTALYVCRLAGSESVLDLPRHGSYIEYFAHIPVDVNDICLVVIVDKYLTLSNTKPF